MEAIILAGGMGTRLRPVLSDLPKPLAPILNRPFLEILLDYLSCQGFLRIILAVGYMSERIIQYFGSSYNGMQIHYVCEEMPLGTGGAIKSALKAAASDHVYVLNGDTFADVDYKRLDSFWSDLRAPVLVVTAVQDPLRYGNVLIRNGYVTGFAEKAEVAAPLINSGIYVLPSNIFAKHSPDIFSFETDFLSSIGLSLGFRAYVHDGLFIDIGIPSDYFKAGEILGRYVS